MTAENRDFFVPRVNNVRAMVTTKWDRRGYRAVRMDNIETYFFDTSLDNDSDQWTIEIGDPGHANVQDLLRRDNEVRMRLFGIGRASQAIAAGIADEVRYTDAGTLELMGRDYSSLATDSTATPQQFRHSLAHRIVEKQARAIRMPGPFNLAHVKTKKYQYVDGSESYWDFWYRLYRKERMWIWCGPSGQLNAQKLNYGQDPVYFFGEPGPNTPRSQWSKWMPITSFQFTKNMQNRVADIWVYGHRGDNGFLVKTHDPKARGWVKRTRKVMLDTDSHTPKQASRMAWEEFFEGTVGELELSIIIVDPGHLILQNRMCKLRIPDYGIAGEFFIVGTRTQANDEGFIQEIRLREKNYAISRRVPDDPKIVGKPKKTTLTSLSSTLTIADAPHSWTDYFIRAAKEFHRPWDFAIFLATLLGMADQETGFRNIRSNGGPGGSGIEWYPFDAHSLGAPDYKVVDDHGRTRRQWETIFANEPGEYTSQTWAVGIMQLYSLTYKHWADDYFRANHRDQYTGGRWHPEWNIRAAARALREKLRQTVGETGRDIDIWKGVAAYNGGGPAAAQYAQSVKAKVYNNPGYLGQVNDALDAAREAQKVEQADPAASTGAQAPAGSGPLGRAFPYRTKTIGFPYVGTHTIGNWQSDNAVDLRTEWRSPVYAVHDGRIGNWGILPGTGFKKVQQRNEGGTRFAGNRVNVIGGNVSSYYAHLADLAPWISTGATVKRGQLIGWTGIANGVLHLHFAVSPPHSPFTYTGGDPRRV